MKVEQYTVDWKEDFELKVINKIADKVGGKKCIQIYEQNSSDDKVMYISSRLLTPEELNELWDEGDLWAWEGPISGRTFKDVLKKLRIKHKLALADE